MMKKFKVALAVISMGATSSALVAEPNLKVCVYDPEIVMSQSKELSGLMTDMEKKYQKQFDGLKQREDALRAEATKLQKDAAAFQATLNVVNESAREQGQDALMRRQRKLEGDKLTLDNEAKRVLEDYNRDRQNANMRFLKKLEDGVGSFAQANSFDLMIPRGPGVYALASADQTKALVSHMNKKFDDNKKPAAGLTVAKK